jgi:C1A family cysteine protease
MYRSFIATAVVLLLVATAGNTQELKEAPVNTPGNIDLPEGRGFIPPGHDLSHLTPAEPPAGKVSALPTSWDWRSQGKVTSIKNQGSCGACYTFGVAANFESRILVEGGSTVDLSENNLKECHYYGNSCSGGNFDIIADFLSKNGTVLESCDAYVASDVACNSGCTYQHTLLDWHIISGGTTPSTATLKQYIYDYGPLYTTIYTGDGEDNAFQTEFNTYDGSYTLHYARDDTTNHAVTIVGWDDDLVHAGGTGGWIVKNSWGTSWGGTCGYGAESGYFTIAYESANIGQYSSYVMNWQDYSSSSDIYYYDEGGWSASWGYGVTTCWGLSKFVVGSDHYVTRVEFWTNDVTTDVDVYLYDDFNGSTPSNLLASKLDTGFANAGYHSIAFSSAPQVSAGEDVYAVVKITNSTYTYPMVADTVSPAETATTYISSNGSSGSWYDLGVDKGNDVAIRIRTAPTLSLDVEDDENPTPSDFRLQHNYPNPFNTGTTISYQLDRAQDVSLEIYDLLGRRVSTLHEGQQRAGNHRVVWDGRTERGGEAATGVYLYRLRVGDQSQSRKMLLLK